MVNVTMLIISTIWFMLDLSVSSVPRPYLHMLGSSSLTWVFCVCKTGLHPLYVNVELITPDHHVVSQHEELLQWCILKDNTYTLKLSERSSYNATVDLSKIRCIKDKLLGNVVISKKFLRTRKIMVMHSNERGECCPRTLVDGKRKR